MYETSQWVKSSGVNLLMRQSEQSTNGEHCNNDDDVIIVSAPEPDHRRVEDEHINSNGDDKVDDTVWDADTQLGCSHHGFATLYQIFWYRTDERNC